MTMPQLIPEPAQVLEMLKKTGAYREGHFVYPSGQHTPHYFQMPLAFRYYDTARVLAVALSRKFRVDRDISSHLPKVAIISRFESTGGGGNSTALLNGVLNSTFRRNHYRSRPGVTINTQGGLIDKCGKGNVFEDNRTDGALTPQITVCP